MLDRFTYKQKNYGLLGLLILLCMVTYKRSFVHTLDAWNEIENQENQLAATKHVEQDIETLQMQIIQLNNNIGKSDVSHEKVQQKILSTISDFGVENEVNLEQLEQTHDFKTVDFSIYSNLIAVEGSFNGILSLVYHMENEFDYARVTNVMMYKEKELNYDNYKSKNKLYAKILFQHYRQN